MDETDKPRDSFDIPSLENDLHQQLQQAIERSKQPTIEEQWTPEEQAELNSELARIPFNPNHSNPDFPDRVALVDGEEVQVHHYNNFPIILSVMDTLRHAKQAPEALSFEATYAAVAADRKYTEIFDALEASYPAIYKRTKQIFGNRVQAVPLTSGLSKEMQTYIQSQAYSAAASLAQKIDPSYNLDYLRK